MARACGPLSRCDTPGRCLGGRCTPGLSPSRPRPVRRRSSHAGAPCGTGDAAPPCSAPSRAARLPSLGVGGPTVGGAPAPGGTAAPPGAPPGPGASPGAPSPGAPEGAAAWRACSLAWTAATAWARVERSDSRAMHDVGHVGRGERALLDLGGHRGQEGVVEGLGLDDLGLVEGVVDEGVEFAPGVLGDQLEADQLADEHGELVGVASRRGGSRRSSRRCRRSRWGRR